MKKITSLLLALCMLVCACVLPAAAADPISPIQLLLVDALGWNTTAMEQFRQALVATETGDVTAIVDDTFLQLIDDNASAQAVKDLTEAEVEAALTAFKNVPTPVTKRSVQEIYTKREFAPEGFTDAFINFPFNGIGGYVGDGLNGFIPATGNVSGYNFENIRKDINELITGDPENNNGLKFALLYMREEAFLNWKLGGLDKAETEIATYNKTDGTYDFYLNDGITSDIAKEYNVSSTNALIEMIDSLNTAISTSAEDTSTTTVLGGGNISGKFMTYVENLLSCPSYDYEETFSFYKFLVDKKRQDEGIIIKAIGVAPADSSLASGSTINSGASIALFPSDPDDVTPTTEIYYTLDGSTPVYDAGTDTWTNGIKFDGSIVLTGNDGDSVTVTAVVIKGETGSKEISMPASFVYEINVPAGGGGGGARRVTVSFETNEGDPVDDITTSYGGTVTIDKVPTKPGYIFDGWYLDPALTLKAPAKIIVKEDTTLYAKWVPTGGTPVFSDDHFAYIVGYPDGTVRPETNVSREEAATVFFRLLTETVRNANITKTNNFADVAETRWSNTAISTMANMGVVTGYADSTFRPAGAITRAELAAMISRFDNTGLTGYSNFTDIEGHWAEDEIGIAVAHGWITGYEDGSFRPNAYVTRAEFVTMVNRVTGRNPETQEDLLSDMITWPDNLETAWYYVDVQEATNSHYYEAKVDSEYKKWTELRPARDWTELEK